MNPASPLAACVSTATGHSSQPTQASVGEVPRTTAQCAVPPSGVRTDAGRGHVPRSTAIGCLGQRRGAVAASERMQVAASSAIGATERHVSCRGGRTRRLVVAQGPCASCQSSGRLEQRRQVGLSDVVPRNAIVANSGVHACFVVVFAACDGWVECTAMSTPTGQSTNMQTSRHRHTDTQTQTHRYRHTQSQAHTYGRRRRHGHGHRHKR